jgi:hypothetical protein
VKGLVDFSRLAREIAARFNEIWQKHGVSASIETLEGWLIFPDLHARLPPDSTKSGKNMAFPPRSKCLRAGGFFQTDTRMGRPIQRNLAKTPRFRLNRNA